jgi:hypothetical protein
MRKKIIVPAISLMAAAMVPFAAISITNADAQTTAITPSVYRSERLEAVAQVLKTTPAAVQTAAKDKTLKELVSNAGLTKTTFRKDVKSQLTTDLENMGYSQAEITSRMHTYHKHHMHKK